MFLDTLNKFYSAILNVFISDFEPAFASSKEPRKTGK